MEKSELEEIKSKIDIVSLVSGYVSLTKSGRNFKALCPFHNEKTPSFMVSPELQIFKCFGCQRGGDAFAFIQEAEGLDFPASVRYLADKAGVKIELRTESKEKSRKDLILEVNHLAAEYFRYVLTKHKLGEKALAYLKEKRKLSDQTLEAFSIGYAPNSWRSLTNYLIKKGYTVDDLIASGLTLPAGSASGFYDRFRGRVAIPFRNLSGDVIGFSARGIFDENPKYINTPETDVFRKGNVLFGLDRAKVNIKRAGLAVVVEGPVDVMSAHQAGFGNVVASGGTSLTLDQLTLLKRFTKDVAFCFDTDFAGFEAVNRAIELAETLGLNIKVVVLPKPYKDLDECVRNSPESARKALEDSISVYDFYFLSALSRNNQFDPLGKKRITEFLAPVIMSIKNPVMREHYVKRLSSELGTSEDSVYSLLQSFAGGVEKTRSPIEEKAPALEGVPLQEYLLSTILKSPLDLAQASLYKLAQRDFTENGLGLLFVELKNHLIGRKKKFDIKPFCAKLEGGLGERAQTLYLREVGEFSLDGAKLREELATLIKRLKAETVKRELKILGNKIKEAEASQDSGEVKRLLEEFKEVSERLT